MRIPGQRERNEDLAEDGQPPRAEHLRGGFEVDPHLLDEGHQDEDHERNDGNEVRQDHAGDARRQVELVEHHGERDAVGHGRHDHGQRKNRERRAPLPLKSVRLRAYAAGKAMTMEMATTARATTKVTKRRFAMSCSPRHVAVPFQGQVLREDPGYQPLEAELSMTVKSMPRTFPT